MSTPFPDIATMRTALALACRAPSVRNVQPWVWRVGAESLQLYSDQARQLIRTDPDGREVMLSCGAVLNHCVVALAALGWQSKIHHFPNPADPSHLASIEVHPYSASEVDISLAAAIPRRRTDHRHFSAWPVSHGDVSMMGARAARMGVAMRRVERLEALPADDCGVLLALGTNGDDVVAWLRSGAATSLVLLTATALGLASCPVIEPLQVREMRDAVRMDAFGDDHCPQMLVRVGWASVNADPLPASPRRPLDDVVTWLDGAESPRRQ